VFAAGMEQGLIPLSNELKKQLHQNKMPPPPENWKAMQKYLLKELF
jgi:hypothetical protein